MLAKEHLEYPIVISVECNISTNIRSNKFDRKYQLVSECYYIFIVIMVRIMKYFKNITDVVVNALLNSSLKRSKYEFAMSSFVV
ncbi:hypothetical protein T4D_11142 [Trichinella pseudospiralis]|uniref:Uncharacterized protein n=1 Tax=Trichinella pseudospiralis TaxID=6337 RepID=A0A0V1F5V0_TRIPS|nr:hypothetical protein T4D_11142 [Trichinella pseudospiralis]